MALDTLAHGWRLDVIESDHFCPQHRLLKWWSPNFLKCALDVFNDEPFPGQYVVLSRPSDRYNKVQLIVYSETSLVSKQPLPTFIKSCMLQGKLIPIRAGKTPPRSDVVTRESITSCFYIDIALNSILGLLRRYSYYSLWQ